MKILLVIIPIVFILVDAIFNILKLENFWQKINLGRRLSLLATSTSFIALVHFHFSAVRKTEPIVKFFPEEIWFFCYIGACWLIFTLLTGWDLYLEFARHITEDPQGRTFHVLKKHRSNLEDFSNHFVVYVIASLYAGTTTILSLVFLYCYDDGNRFSFAKNCLSFAKWVYIGIGLFFLIYIVWSFRYRGTISGPEYDPTRHAVEIV